MTLAGFANIYHLIYYGDETRVRVEAEGEVVEDIGTPLSAERFFDDEKYPEDATLKVVYELTRVSPEQRWDAQWREVTPRKPGLLKRLFKR